MICFLTVLNPPAMISWDILNNVDDLNEKVDVFNSFFRKVVEPHAPISQSQSPTQRKPLDYTSHKSGDYTT